MAWFVRCDSRPTTSSRTPSSEPKNPVKASHCSSGTISLETSGISRLLLMVDSNVLAVHDLGRNANEHRLKTVDLWFH